MNELIGPIKPGESSKVQRIIDAVRADRWLPILNPPFDPRNISSPKLRILTEISNILGPLAVALHVAYEEAYRVDSSPLLKANKGSGRFQYLAQTPDPNFYFLIFLRGTQKGFWSDKALLCQQAKFILMPETRMNAVKNNFAGIFTRKSSDDDFPWLPYLPTLDVRSRDSFIADSPSTTTILFNSRGEIGVLGQYTKDGKEAVSVTSYNFSLDKGIVRAMSFSNEWLNLWDNQYSWRCDNEYVLNQDGIFRSKKGKPADPTLGMALNEITTRLPLTHYEK